MGVVAIPDWNGLGLIPPVDPAGTPATFLRSPYLVSLKDLVMRFVTSPERWYIMNGFVRYRSALHAMGLVDGFQWIDGSFTEDIETLEQRPPKDVDVVTFLTGTAGFIAPPNLMFALDHDETKARFQVDSYYVELDLVTRPQLVTWSAYWYSMWAHRRSQVWKGFLQLELAPNEDMEAADWLGQNRPDGVAP